MGLTVHYSGGKAKSRVKIEECVGFLVDVAKRLPCEYEVVDRKMTGTLDYWRKKKNPLQGKRITVHQKGVTLFLDPMCEPLSFLFDYDSLEFCFYFHSYKSQTLNKTGFFCKTQYATNFIMVHHTACKLLEIIKKNYVSGLKVYDDGEYYGNWNQKKLAKTIQKWNSMIANFGRQLDGAGLKFEGAGMELYKDAKLNELFGSSKKRLLAKDQKNIKKLLRDLGK